MIRTVRPADQHANFAEGSKWPFPITIIDALDPRTWGDMVPTSDGLVHYRAKGPVSTNTFQDLYDKVVLMEDDLDKLRQYGNFENGDLSNVLIHADNLATYTITKTSHALAAGVLANAELIAAVAAERTSLAWVIVSWDIDPAAFYTLSFHEAGGGVVPPIAYLPPGFRGNRKVYVYVDTATVNTALQVDLAGGAGVEVIDIITSTIQFT